MYAIRNMLSIAAQSAVRVVSASLAVHRGASASLAVHRGASLDERRPLVQFMIDVSAEHSAKRPCRARCETELVKKRRDSQAITGDSLQEFEKTS